MVNTMPKYPLIEVKAANGTLSAMQIVLSVGAQIEEISPEDAMEFTSTLASDNVEKFNEKLAEWVTVVE